MSWRRLWSLIHYLPRDSHYASAVGGEQTQWGHVEHLLATVVDVLQIGNWIAASAASKNRVAKPVALARPGMKPRGEGNRLGSAIPLPVMRRLLDRWRNGTPKEATH